MTIYRTDPLAVQTHLILIALVCSLIVHIILMFKSVCKKITYLVFLVLEKKNCN